MHAMRNVTVGVAVGLVLIGVAVVVILSRSPLTVVGTNSIPAKDYIQLESQFSNCQPAGTLPRGTSAIRIAIEGIYFNPAVTVRVLTHSHLLREGEQVAGGGPAPTATVHIGALPHTVYGARVCTTVGPAGEPVRFSGMPGANNAGGPQDAVLRMEYLRPGPRSWWSLAPSIAYHMGLGRSPGGTWVVFLALTLMLAIVLGASRLTLKELR